MKINEENWKFARLNRKNLLAFISFGGHLDNENQNILYEYSVLLTDMEYKEKFCTTYNSLQAALFELNIKYGQWEILKNIPSSSGCDSCAAH